MKKNSPPKKININIFGRRMGKSVGQEALSDARELNSAMETYSQKIERDLEAALSCGTSSTATDAPTATLTVEMMQRAVELIERAAEPPMVGDDTLWGANLNLSGGLNYIRNGRDYVTMHGIGGATERPVKEERYDCVAKAMVEAEGFRAELLDSNWKLWDESDLMRNCVYRSYRRKVQEGSYRLYHVSGVKGFSNGVTVGYVRARSEDADTETDEVVILERWKVDQIKGKANSAVTDRALQEFCDKVGDGMKVERREKRVVMENTLRERGKMITGIMPRLNRTVWDWGT